VILQNDSRRGSNPIVLTLLWSCQWRSLNLPQRPGHISWNHRYNRKHLEYSCQPHIGAVIFYFHADPERNLFSDPFARWCQIVFYFRAFIPFALLSLVILNFVIVLFGREPEGSFIQLTHPFGLIVLLLQFAFYGLRYGRHELYLEAFLGSLDSIASGLAATASHLGYEAADLPTAPTYMLTPAIPTAGRPILLRPSFARSYRYRNINLFPIGYAFRPRLRDRLTLGRLALPRKPRVYGERVFHPFYRYLCQHKHFSSVQLASQLAFCQKRTLPYHNAIRHVQSFGNMLSPVTFSAQNH